jgi:hypothetical protein
MEVQWPPDSIGEIIWPPDSIGEIILPYFEPVETPSGNVTWQGNSVTFNGENVTW